jgi:hypothetical protein
MARLEESKSGVNMTYTILEANIESHFKDFSGHKQAL